MAISNRILSDINKYSFLVKKLMDRNSLVFLSKEDYSDLNNLLCVEFDMPFIIKSEYSIDNIISMLKNTLSEDIDEISISLFVLIVNQSPFLSLNDLTAFFIMVEFRNKNCVDTNIDEKSFYKAMQKYRNQDMTMEEFVLVMKK